MACHTAQYDDPNRPIPMSPAEQQRYGAIVTLENAEGTVLVIHHVGPIEKAVRRAYAEAVSVDASFRILTVSTPTSIYEDMQGGRKDQAGSFSGRAVRPEQKYGAMLHPRLRVGA